MKGVFFVLPFLAVLMLAEFLVALRRDRGGSVMNRRLGKTDEKDIIEKAAWDKARKWKNPFAGVAGRMAKKSSETDNARLRAAGMGSSLSVEDFISLKLLVGLGAFAVFTTLGVFGLGLTAMSLGLMMGGLGYMVPEIWLTLLVSSRKTKIEKGLLNFVTMLAVTCEAGLNLGEALSRVAEELGGQIGEEVERILTEARMGGIRSRAMKDAAERYDSADLSLVFGTMATAEEHGTPIVGVLKEVARQLRQARKNRAQEQAQKASVKILVPIIVCMFVPLAVVLIGPPVMNLFQSLSL